jgi:hypothetical protein
MKDGIIVDWHGHAELKLPVSSLGRLNQLDIHPSVISTRRVSYSAQQICIYRHEADNAHGGITKTCQ